MVINYYTMKPILHAEVYLNKNILDRSITIRKAIFLLAAISCLTPFVSPPIALLMGLVIAQLIGHPYLHLNHKATNILLQVSVVGLGFGMNVTSAISTGKQGVIFTIASIISTLTIGYLLGKLFKVEKKTSFLIATGTAICGGSAIAAISPVIKARKTNLCSVRHHIYFKLYSLIFIPIYW